MEVKRMPDMGMEMASAGETTSLSLEKYPKLQGLEVGAPVSGEWTGKISSIENGVAKIQYDTLEIETENSADRELKKLSNQQDMGTDETDDEDEDY